MNSSPRDQKRWNKNNKNKEFRNSSRDDKSKKKTNSILRKWEIQDTERLILASTCKLVWRGNSKGKEKPKSVKDKWWIP